MSLVVDAHVIEPTTGRNTDIINTRAVKAGEEPPVTYVRCLPILVRF